MNSAAILAAAFPALLTVGVLLALLPARRDTSQRPKGDERGEDSEILDVRPPSAAGGDRYYAKWSALQAKFSEQLAEGSAASSDLITKAF